MSYHKGSFSRRGLLAGMAIALSVAGLVGIGGSAARALTPDEIKKKGSMMFAIFTDQVPLGYTDDKGEFDGYDVSIARMMAKDLGVEPKFQPITSASRIPLLLTGKVDMLICGLGMYPDRAKVIQYVAPYAAIQEVIYGAKDSTVSKMEDLGGHSIAVPKGSSMDKRVTAEAPKSTDIHRYDDDSSTVQALLSGQTELLGDYSFEFEALEKASPGKFAPKVVLSTEYEGIAVKPSDKELAAWGRDFIKRHEADGSLGALHQKYFATPLPKFPESMEGIPY